MDGMLSTTGGARVGWVNASWPFAQLSASAAQLSLSVFLVGWYAFNPDDVVALEPHGTIPLLGAGVRIVHVNPKYPEKIIFWCAGSPRHLIQRILDRGFRPQAARSALPRGEGIAWRWSFLALVFVAWNGLFLLDTFIRGAWPPRPGAFSLLAVALLFLCATALRRSRRLQALALKPGRSVSEVLAEVRLVLVVSGFLLVMLLVMTFVAT